MNPAAPRSGSRGAGDRVLMASVVVLALLLRLWDLDRRELGHPENYVPDIPVPSWVENPPPRMDYKGILRGTLRDGHPPAYFLFLHPWAKLFGISMFSLRLPSALLGAASCGLLYVFARRRCGRGVALLASGLLALHGYHIFWSQMARMYVPAAFLCLASALLMEKLYDDGRRRWQVLYIATTAAALLTQLYCWPFVFTLMLLSVLRDLGDGHAPRALRSHVAAVLLAFPTVSLSIYQNPEPRFSEPGLEYLRLGNLFTSTAFLWGPSPTPWIPVGIVIAGTIALLLASLAGRETTLRPEHDGPAAGRASSDVPMWFIMATACVVTAGLEAFAYKAPRHDRYTPASLYVASAMPLVLAAGLPLLLRFLGGLAGGASERLRTTARRLHRPGLALAVLPYFIMVVVNQARASFVARGTVVFIPFLMLAVAQGVAAAARVRWLGAVVIAALIVIQIDGVRHVRAAESCPVDYRGLAAQLRAQLRPSDLILVHNRYNVQPLFYYMPAALRQFVHERMTDAVRRLPAPRRVWVVSFPREDMGEGMTEAVQGLAMSRELNARKIRAQLYATSDAAR